MDWLKKRANDFFKILKIKKYLSSNYNGNGVFATLTFTVFMVVVCLILYVGYATVNDTLAILGNAYVDPPDLPEHEISPVLNGFVHSYGDRIFLFS